MAPVELLVLVNRSFISEMLSGCEKLPLERSLNLK